MLDNDILLIPDKKDEERDSLANTWKNLGGEVKRVGKFWIKPKVGNKRVSLYGFDTFCLVLAQQLDLVMIEVKDESIAEVPLQYLKRKIQIKKLEEIAEDYLPRFIKPVTPKLFKAGIVNNLVELKITIGIEKHEQLICSEIIQIEKEVRCFILEGKIQDLAFYEGEGNLEEAKIFIEGFLISCNLNFPKTFVIDIGYNNEDNWFIIEFNSSWGAGLNNCEPEKMIYCIRESIENKKCK